MVVLLNIHLHQTTNHNCPNCCRQPDRMNNEAKQFIQVPSIPLQKLSAHRLNFYLTIFKRHLLGKSGEGWSTRWPWQEVLKKHKFWTFDKKQHTDWNSQAQMHNNRVTIITYLLRSSEVIKVSPPRQGSTGSGSVFFKIRICMLTIDWHSRSASKYPCQIHAQNWLESVDLLRRRNETYSVKVSTRLILF